MASIVVYDFVYIFKWNQKLYNNSGDGQSINHNGGGKSDKTGLEQGWKLDTKNIYQLAHINVSGNIT